MEILVVYAFFFFFFFLYAAFKKKDCTRTQSAKPIFIIILIFKIFASQVNVFREGTVGDHQPVRA